MKNQIQITLTTEEAKHIIHALKCTNSRNTHGGLSGILDTVERVENVLRDKLCRVGENTALRNRQELIEAKALEAFKAIDDCFVSYVDFVAGFKAGYDDGYQRGKGDAEETIIVI